jgi:hypothetical protein
MRQPEEPDRTEAVTEVQGTTKKPYYKPEFRFERVFETQALTCGKTATQTQCNLNTKNS